MLISEKLRVTYKVTVWMLAIILLVYLIIKHDLGFWGMVLWFLITSVIANLANDNEKSRTAKILKEEYEARKKERVEKETERTNREAEEFQKRVKEAIEDIRERIEQHSRKYDHYRNTHADEFDDIDNNDEEFVLTPEVTTQLRNLLMKHHNSHGTDKDYMSSKMASETSRMIQMFNDAINKNKRRVS